MLIIRHHEDVPASHRGSVVALGNFDGFHRGHQVVVGEAGRLARTMGCRLGVVTTEPHPRSFFKPDDPPFRLTPFRERAALLEAFGVDVLGVLPFDATLRGMAAEDFVNTVLLKGFGAVHVVVGYDYRFGKGRGGDTDVLAKMGEAEGFGLTVIEPVRFGVEGAAGQTYSSSLVRQTLGDGMARNAAALLGHWWAVNGLVVKGDQRGRTIGFPTANIELGESLQPAFGVYAVRVQLEGHEDRVFNGIANLGKRPTFDKQDVLLEVHLFDFDEDVYGRHARVEFVGFVRPERKFEGLEALKSQITTDCETARAILADPENARDRLLPGTLDDYLATHPRPPGAE